MSESILLLAPSTGLPRLLSEVERVVSAGIPVTPLISKTTYDEVLDAVSTGDYSIFWYSGHLGPSGIDLEDEKISIPLLSSLLRGRFRLIVLNTCQSQDLARTLFLEGDVAVVGTVSEVPDLEAFQVGVLFLRAFLKSHNIEQAYHQVRTSSYILLSKEVKVGRSMDELTKALYDLRTELYSAKTEIAVLSQRVGAWEHTLDSTLRNFSQPTSVSPINPYLLQAIAVMLFIICMLLGIIVIRGMG